jgi:hypothetical protein
LKPLSRGFGRTTWFPRLKSCVHMLLHFALKQMLLHFLTSGTPAPFLHEWTTLHQQKSRWKLAPGCLTSGGDHLCISSDNDLRSGWYASSSDHLRVSAAVKGPRPRPPTGGDNEAIKAKESGTQRQVAPMVPTAEATTSARGSLTSGSHHLSTDDHGHLRIRGPCSRSPTE